MAERARWPGKRAHARDPVSGCAQAPISASLNCGFSSRCPRRFISLSPNLGTALAIDPDDLRARVPCCSGDADRDLAPCVAASATGTLGASRGLVALLNRNHTAPSTRSAARRFRLSVLGTAVTLVSPARRRRLPSARRRGHRPSRQRRTRPARTRRGRAPRRRRPGGVRGPPRRCQRRARERRRRPGRRETRCPWATRREHDRSGRAASWTASLPTPPVARTMSTLLPAPSGTRTSAALAAPPQSQPPRSLRASR